MDFLPRLRSCFFISGSVDRLLCHELYSFSYFVMGCVSGNHSVTFFLKFCIAYLVLNLWQLGQVGD